MLLKALLGHYEALGDAFLSTFPLPFLLEEGFLELEGRSGEGRQVHYLQSDRETEPRVIGRKAPVDIRLLDRNVSGKHAQIHPPAKVGEPWKIEDLGSSNGTFLNGEAIEAGTPTVLKDETLIGLGPTTHYVFLEPQTFLSVLRQQASQRDSPRGDTGRLPQYGKTLVAQAALDDLGDVATEEPKTGLYLFCEPFDPMPLSLEQPVVVGRSAAHADLVLPHPNVSRRHAEFTAKEDGVYVRDLHSANGVFMGSTRIQGTNEVQVPGGHVVQIADFKIVVKGTMPEKKADTFVLAPETRRKKIRGSLEKMPLESLLVSIEEKNKSGSLELVADEVSGLITFHAGKPYRAQTSDGKSGVEALRELLQLKSADFAVDPNATDPGRREISETFGELVLEDFFDHA